MAVGVSVTVTVKIKYYLRWVNFANHDPGHNQVAQGAGDGEDEDAGNWYPRVDWLDVVRFPILEPVHVGA